MSVGPSIVNVAYDDSALLLRMRNGQKKLAYAVVNAINKTAKKVQQAEFARVRAKFIIRKPSFFFGSDTQPGGVAAKLGPSPDIKAGRMYRDIFTGAAAVRGKRNVLLPTFEEGGTRFPTPPSKHIAVPLLGRPAHPAINRGIPPAFTFAGLAFRGFRRGKAIKRRRRGRTVGETVFGEFGRVQSQALQQRAIQYKGKQRTFIIPGRGVFQRIGPARGDVRMIYKFMKSVPIDARLGFVQTATATADRYFAEFMRAEVADAILHEAARAVRVAA